MKDNEVIEILTTFLTKYPLDENERDAVREAIGILSWSKLMEGYIERKKKARDRRMNLE